MCQTYSLYVFASTCPKRTTIVICWICFEKMKCQKQMFRMNLKHQFIFNLTKTTPQHKRTLNRNVKNKLKLPRWKNTQTVSPQMQWRTPFYLMCNNVYLINKMFLTWEVPSLGRCMSKCNISVCFLYVFCEFSIISTIFFNGFSGNSPSPKWKTGVKLAENWCETHFRFYANFMM